MATTADVLRRAADLIEKYELDQFDVVHVIRQAAAEHTPFGLVAYKLADAAARALAQHLRYGVDSNPARELKRWSQIRTTSEIVAELRSAADAAVVAADIRARQVVLAPEWNDGQPVRITQVHRVHGDRVAVRYQDARCRKPARAEVVAVGMELTLISGGCIGGAR
ncbi:DUF6197 family protein [Nonomuraea dietziae]|uniref:DUF6197 family protein n=1 Tax=Nonomuraea dietziae TaxID=65515 RepID=UPI00340DF39B